MAALAADAAAAIMLAAAFINGMRRGLVKSVWRASAWIITAALTFVLLQPVTAALSATKLADSIGVKVHETVTEKFTQDNGGEEKKELPGFLTKGVDTEAIKNGGEAAAAAIDSLSRTITLLLIKIIACIALFIVLRIVLTILIKTLDLIAKLPVIHGANKLLGGLLGIISMLFVIYLICTLISLFAADDKVMGVINSTYLVKYFYNNNFILQIVLKI